MARVRIAHIRTGSHDVLDHPSRVQHSELMNLSVADPMTGQRLAWPAAAAVIVVVSVMLWGVIALAFSHL